MKQLCLVVLLAVVVSANPACRRKAPPEPPVVLEKNAPERLPTAPKDSSLRLPVQQELTSALHLFRNDYQKLPPDFETLVKLRYLKAMPQPPPGKHFALDRNRLQVVILDGTPSG